MNKHEILLQEITQKLLKALDHLAYSYNKVMKLPTDLSVMDDEQMETWESFTSRFSRVSDIFIMQYLRTKMAIEEPGFRGTTRDYLNNAEKLNLIQDVKQWVNIRELRNVAAHEYNNTDLSAFYEQLRALCPVLLSIRSVIAG